MEKSAIRGGEQFLGKSGKVRLTSPVSGVVVLRMAGFVTADLVPGQLVLLDRIHANNPVSTDFYYDLWEMSSYDSALRVELTNWHLRHRGTLRSLHTVTRSKLVMMGVTVANVALRVITQHPTMASFEASLNKAVANMKTA